MKKTVVGLVLAAVLLLAGCAVAGDPIHDTVAFSPEDGESWTVQSEKSHADIEFTRAGDKLTVTVTPAEDPPSMVTVDDADAQVAPKAWIIKIYVDGSLAYESGVTGETVSYTLPIVDKDTEVVVSLWQGNKEHSYSYVLKPQVP